MIPRIIHQTWKDERLPPLFQESRESWQTHHPDWTYILWTDDALDDFVRAVYPNMWPLYQRYPERIQRVDAVRYMLLHHYGGLYSDLDIVCRRPFDDFLGYDVVLRQNAPRNVTNDLMLARSGDPFFARIIDELEPAYRRWQHRYVVRTFRVFLTAGPYFLTGVYQRYGEKHRIQTPSREFNAAGDIPRGAANAYVAHTYGNTWASWDTYVLMFFYRQLRWLIARLSNVEEA